LLLHCILAVSYKHIGRDTGAYQREAKTHKRTAFRMLKDVEGELTQGPVRANFLDALLILMTLDVRNLLPQMSNAAKRIFSAPRPPAGHGHGISAALTR
jgi:hypothetical protein